jgi:diaminohydroxyphosphoribosylaminopyrimidine deaminase / 5-amino-6-(5-phosphoribosylamino)uracil reductase
MAQLPSQEADRHWLLEAIGLSRYCPPSATAFSVGAVIVGQDGTVLGYGHSRERDPADHAEEVALARAAEAGVDAVTLGGSTLYSSLEPCAARASRPVPCADLIIASGIDRVVIAWREPPIFVPGGGAVRMRKAGLAVVVIPELAATAKAVNAHLLTDLTAGAPHASVTSLTGWPVTAATVR